MNDMKKIYILIFVLCCAVTSPRAAETVLLKVAGITGEVIQKGREGQMEVLAWNHEVSTPVDAASGLPTGKRSHAPFRVVLRHSRGTPLLAQSLAENKTIATVDMDMWQVGPTGIDQKYFTYSFTNCRVISMRAWAPNKLDSATASYVSGVEVSFTYQTVTWTSPSAGITFTDSVSPAK
jgi:type VI secretion system secreted protein Hcp